VRAFIDVPTFLKEVDKIIGNWQPKAMEKLSPFYGLL
jgi:hypothetical protein